MEHNTQERELNLLDMFWYILLKWRPIIIAAFLFAVLFAGYSYYSSMKQIQSHTKEQVEEIVLQEADELMIARYLEYMDIYAKQLIYNEESPLMKLDPNGYYEGDVQYFVQVDGQTSEATQNAVVCAYENVLCSEEFYQSVGAILGDEIKENYYNEIIDYTQEMEKIAYSIDGGSNESSKNGMLSIKIRVEEKEKCEQLVNLVKEEITKNMANIASRVVQHNLTEIKSNISFTSDETVFMYQKCNSEKSSMYNASVAGLENQLTAKELAYAKQQLNHAERPSEEKDVSDKEVGNEADQMLQKPQVSKKLVILGFLLGGFLGVVFSAFIYLINGCIRLEHNFDKSYGVKLLGCIKAEENKKKKFFSFLDNWLWRMRYSNVQAMNLEEAIPMIVTNIKIACDKEGKRKLTITKSGASEAEKEVLKAVVTRLQKEGIEASEGNTILQDWAALENAAKTSMLVLVETANKTSAFSLKREIEVCKGQGTKVIGAVVVTE